MIVRTLGTPQLADALESLACQTRRDFELVFVDMSDGRAERTLCQAASRLPAVRVLSLNKPVSRPRALNLGIAASGSPRIGILDEDNLYDPPHLDRLIAGFEESGADYVYTGVRHATFLPDGRPIDSRDVAVPFRFERVILGNYIYATGSAFSKCWSDRRLRRAV